MKKVARQTQSLPFATSVNVREDVRGYGCTWLVGAKVLNTWHLTHTYVYPGYSRHAIQGVNGGMGLHQRTHSRKGVFEMRTHSRCD